MKAVSHHAIAACIFTVACMTGTAQVLAQPSNPSTSGGNGLSMQSYCQEFEAQGKPGPAESAGREARSGKRLSQDERDQQVLDALVGDMEKPGAAGAAPLLHSSRRMSTVNSVEGPDPAVMNAACRMAAKLKADNTSRMTIRKRRGR